VRKLGLFWHEWTILKREWNERLKGPRVPKKAQFIHERVEYNVFLFDEPLKGSKSLKTFKISLTFRFDKLWHLSKSVHIGENSQILTVSNKKKYFHISWFHDLRFLTFNFPPSTSSQSSQFIYVVSFSLLFICFFKTVK
jgi:hypothetical protein